MSFKVSSYLLDMDTGDVKKLKLGNISYGSLKSTASQLKRKRAGVWHIERDEDYAYISRRL